MPLYKCPTPEVPLIRALISYLFFNSLPYISSLIYISARNPVPTGLLPYLPPNPYTTLVEQKTRYVQVNMVDALTSDCRVLLARFEKKHSVRFEDFCEIWKEMNFSLIH